jgi:hypothetical protein
MKVLGQTLDHILAIAISFLLYSSNPLLAKALILLTMVASHPDKFQTSSIDEGELLKLIENYLLPSYVILQWRPAKDGDIPTPTPMRSWYYLPFSSMDLAFLLVNSSAAFSIIIRSSWFI